MNHFDNDFAFDMDDSFSPSTGTSFSSVSSEASAYEPFTPSSRRSTPNELIDFNDGPFYTAAPEQRSLVMTPPSPMSNFMFESIKQEPDQMSFTTETVLPSTPMRRIERPFDYEQMLEAAAQISNSVTPSHSFGMGAMSPEGPPMAPAPYMMTPTRSLSAHTEFVDPCSWSLAQESPIAFFHPVGSSAQLDCLSQSPLSVLHNPYSLQSNGASPSNRFRVQRKMEIHEAQQKSSELQRAQIRTSRIRSGRGDAGPVEVARGANAKCNYPGCTKAYQRNEHLKRHKLTYVWVFLRFCCCLGTVTNPLTSSYHGEGKNRFPCEFCGKDQFNREDNLNNHRKLHARPNGRNRGVEFIPDAVPIIEAEERSRKRRAPPKSKLAAERRH